MKPLPTISTRPNRHVFALGAMIFCMWYVGAAQENGSAYLLAFLLTGLVLVSWFHARANLRALELRGGAVPAAEAGEVVPLRLMLSTSGEGRVPCGLEVSMVGALRPEFVETLPAAASAGAVPVTLRVVAEEAGMAEGSEVVVSSYYPLGFFTARRVFRLQQTRLVHPRAMGNRPLPALAKDIHAADDEPSSESSSVESSSKPLAEGDDFAGLRMWQEGEPLRHVDWKAAARGRPLMVKQYAGRPQGRLWLEDAGLLGLPDDERWGQLAKWVREAEAQGLSYGLRVMGQEDIQPGLGTEHERRCLDALAAWSGASAQAKAEEAGKGWTQGLAAVYGHLTRAKPPTLEVSHAVPGRPLAMLAGAMLMALLPFIGEVAWPALLLYALVVLARWLGYQAKPGGLAQTLRVLLVVLGVLGVYVVTGTISGIETGVAVMLCVTAGKLLEARAARDMQVVALLGWFLCACSVALDQSLGRSLYAFTAMMLIAAALVRFRRGVLGVGPPLKATLGLLAQALPLVVLLFLLFPRGTGGFVTQLSRRLSARTGMSGRLDPGSIARIAQSDERAFRVTLRSASGAQPVLPREQLYWRCVVLWLGNGLIWEKGELLGDSPPTGALLPGDLHQTIQMEPNGDTWLPALDAPVRIPGGSTANLWITHADATLHTMFAASSVYRYEVVSRPVIERPGLPMTVMRTALSVPRSISPKVRDLAQALSAEAKEKAKGVERQRLIVQAVLDHFGSNGFRYTMEPGEYQGPGALEEFLFVRRQGFCEHFAASFATLMRLSGVPARVVTGYLGGEYSDSGGYTLVRQCDAHAWAEVWLEGQGWQRVDPTAALAPSRLTTDLRSYLDSNLGDALSQMRRSVWGKALTQAMLLWDNVNYQWYEHVVQYDDLAQDRLLAAWGVVQNHLASLIAAVVIGLALFMLALELWLRRKRQHAEASVRLWQSFCQRLAKAGVTARADEGPLEFATRAARHLPGAAAAITRVAEAYAEARYGAAAGANPDLGSLRSLMDAAAKSLRRGSRSAEKPA